MPSLRARWIVFAVCASTVLLVGVDQSILAVALPAIGADLDAGTVPLEWVVDAYVTAAAAFLISVGVLADRFGRRRMLQLGLLLFAAGSILGALAPSIEMLVLARVVQGLGASALVPVGLAVVATVAADARERAHMIGAWGAVFGIGLAVGPLAGGLLLGSAGWRSVFWATVPVAVAAVVLSALLLPESRAERPRRLDLPGQVLLAVLLGSVVVLVIDGPSALVGGGVGSAGGNAGGSGTGTAVGLPIVAAAAVCAVLAAVGLVVASRRRREPMLPPELFGRPRFVSALVAAAAVFAVLALTLVSGSLALQQAAGRTALEAAIALVPVALAAAVFAPVSGLLVARLGPAVPLLLAAGSILCGGALVAASGAPGAPADALLLAGHLGVGAGFGLANAPVTTTALAGLPDSRTGVAASITATARQLGAALGTAAAGIAAACPAPLVLAGALTVALALPVAAAAVPRAARSPRTPSSGHGR